MAAPALAGTATPADAPPNLLHVQFKNPEFLTYLSQLQAQGLVAPDAGNAGNAGKPAKFDPAHPLSEHNVMAYFATSPFFDRRSNNEQIRMQNIANGIQNLTGGIGARQEEQELKRFTGLEFVLVHARPPLCFVIQKRWRTSPTETTPLAAYYIVNDSIYQAPDMYSVLATRLQSTVYGLQSSLSAQRRARPSFDPRRGHHGRFIIPDPPTSSANPASGTARNTANKTSTAASEQSDDDGAELDDVDLPPATSVPEPAPQKRARFD